MVNTKGFLIGKRERERKLYLAYTIVLRVPGTTDRLTKCLTVESANAPLHLSACYPAVARLRTRRSPPSADGLKIKADVLRGCTTEENDILLKLREDQSNITGHLNCGSILVFQRI